MKRLYIISVALILLMLFASSVYAEDFNVTVKSIDANVGDTVEVEIVFENNSGIIAALFNLEYDKDKLELIEIEDMRLLDGGTFSPDYKSYPYKMVWNSASDKNFTENGTLVKLKFFVLENATSGKAYINLSYNNNDIFDVNLNNVAINIINGYVNVNKKAASSGREGTIRPPITKESDKKSVSKSESNSIVLTIGKKDALVFGQAKTNDVAPLIKNNRTMLPARFIAENLGATVLWNEDTRSVTIKKESIEIIITIDSQIAFVDGKSIVLDSPAFIENDRTYTPLRFIVEKLGATVLWDAVSQKVTIIV